MYKTRRLKLANMLPDNALLFVLSGKSVYGVGDETYPFSVDRNFYYLTGLDKEDMMLIMAKVNGIYSESIVILPFDETLAKWVGGRLLPKEVKKISSIDTVVMKEDLYSHLHRKMNYDFDKEANINVFADLSTQTNDQVTETNKFIKEFNSFYPYVTINNAYSLFTKLRLIKDEHEINQLRKAISVTNEAILNMMRHSKANIGEYELEAYFDFVLKTNKCKHSFPSIVGSGKNATILHYIDNECICNDHDLVLCDLGASYKYYNADITRTFPVNGKFTDRQKQIYDIVLRGNEYIISKVQVGKTLRELNALLIEFYEKELKAIGLLENGKKVSDYYYHGVSHMLGLETHDVSLTNYKLEVGNVLTVEPGLYIEEENIGIRIEDNILVSENGPINLSEEIIKSIEDIEKFMSK